MNVLVLNVHTIYTCCNDFMDIFERQIVKRQICLFAVPQGSDSGCTVFAHRDSTLISSFQWALKGKDQTCIVQAVSASRISVG